ncbi:MAG: LEA type 2 family protein [Flavobacteriales bacterium]|nr:LEA type 2 family protein [Flavobacteriales bacterium]
MTRYFIVRIASLLTLAVLFSSCEIEEVTLVDLERVEVDRIEKQEMFLDVAATLDNPNSFSIKVKESDLDLYLEDRYIGKANLENQFTLESGSQKTYEMQIRAVGERLNTEMLPIMLSAALTGKVNVKLKGTITGKVFLFSRSVDVNIEEDVLFKSQEG